MSEMSEEQKRLYKSTAETLSGSDRRVFRAGVVKTLGKGGQPRAARELGWGRGAIQTGMHELESGLRCFDNFGARGRHAVEERLPNLLQTWRPSWMDKARPTHALQVHGCTRA